MWNTQDIVDLQVVSVDRKQGDGYALNIRPALLDGDLVPFVVTPRAPAMRWADDPGKIEIPLLTGENEDPSRPGRLDFSKVKAGRPVFETIFLVFPDRETAIASSLGKYWEPVDAGSA